MTSTGQRFRGPLLLGLSSALFGVMAFEAKRASARLPGPEVAFFRFCGGLLLIGLALAARRIRLRFDRYDLLIVRGLLGGLAVLCYFTTIAHVDVSVATLLNFTSPIFTALFAARFLGEPVHPRLVFSLALALGGTLVISHAHAAGGRWSFGTWELVGLLGALVSGGAITAVRGLRLADVGPWEITTFFCLAGALCTAPQTAAHFVLPRGGEWGSLFAVGALALLAQVLMNQALGHVGAATAGAISQLTPATALLLGALLLDEPVGARSLVGMAMTCGGVFWASRLAARASSPPDS